MFYLELLINSFLLFLFKYLTMDTNQKSKSKKHLWMGLGGGLLILIILASIRSDKNQADHESKKSTTQNVAVTDTTKAETPVLSPEENWKYSATENKMDGDSTHFATVTADELLQFGFPYNGGSVATLTIRQKKDDLNIMFRVTKGQIISEDRIRVKFDDSPAENWSISEAADYSSDVVFLNNEKTFLKRLRTASKLILEVEFYQEGNRIIEFDVSGLKQ